MNGKIENDENQNLIDDHEEATVGMDEVDNFDFERAMMLMSVMEKVAGVAPRSTAILGLATAALEEMNQEAKDIAKRRAEAFKELERKRDEALEAQRRQREDEELAKQDEEAKAKAQRIEAAKHRTETETETNPPIRPGTQTIGPPPSKTDEVARDNARRL